MDESPTGCWTNHHSIIQFKDQWYLFYHDRDYSPNFDKARSVRADSLFFNEDGTIKQVIRSLRGIGVTKATSEIQIDRYNNKGDGVSIDFLDTLDRFKGWKTIFNHDKDWIQYNTVDFGNKPLKTILVKATAESGALLEIHTASADGPVIALVKIANSKDGKLVKAPLIKFQPGIQNIFVVSKGSARAEVDWISFN